MRGSFGIVMGEKRSVEDTWYEVTVVQYLPVFSVDVGRQLLSFVGE